MTRSEMLNSMEQLKENLTKQRKEIVKLQTVINMMEIAANNNDKDFDYYFDKFIDYYVELIAIAKKYPLFEERVEELKRKSTYCITTQQGYLF